MTIFFRNLNFSETIHFMIFFKRLLYFKHFKGTYYYVALELSFEETNRKLKTVVELIKTDFVKMQYLEKYKQNKCIRSKK